jgi:hypothetical protein
MSPGDPLVNIRAAAIEQTGSDRRISERRVMRVQARISIPGEAPLEVHTVDLSLGGVSITSLHPLSQGLECIVELGICARMRDSQYRIGFKFSTVSIEAAELIVAVLT